jgi:hypothetical protein
MDVKRYMFMGVDFIKERESPDGNIVFYEDIKHYIPRPDPAEVEWLDKPDGEGEYEMLFKVIFDKDGTLTIRAKNGGYYNFHSRYLTQEAKFRKLVGG